MPSTRLLLVSMLRCPGIASLVMWLRRANVPEYGRTRTDAPPRSGADRKGRCQMELKTPCPTGVRPGSRVGGGKGSPGARARSLVPGWRRAESGACCTWAGGYYHPCGALGGVGWQSVGRPVASTPFVAPGATSMGGRRQAAFGGSILGGRREVASAKGANRESWSWATSVLAPSFREARPGRAGAIPSQEERGSPRRSTT